MEEKKTCWVLTGPTASGKTAFSIRLAKKHNCEIICMDSMQIYRGMDIGTAKPTVAEMDGVPHHMIDVAAPTEPFSVSQYQEMAEKCAEDIFARGKQPLFVGGTGFYLRALRSPMAMGVVAGDDALRDELQQIADSEGGKERLHSELAEIDPVTAERLHLNDVRRVIRAIEVYRLTGIPFSQQPVVEGEAKFDYKVVSLTMDRALLYSRIEKRVDIMLEDGLIGEVRGLLANGVPADAQALKAIGYKEIIPYLSGEWTLEKAVYELKKGTRHYAKRQLTWMRSEKDVLWIDALGDGAYDEMEKYYTEQVERES